MEAQREKTLSARLKLNLKDFQDGFWHSLARYPAFLAGWGTGKTLFGILRGLDLSQEIIDNLGLVVRKEFTDLRDSTIKDFEKYTGKTLDSNKEVKLFNGSTIMFRHGAELDALKNINLGWFLIEQAEEFETEEQFEFLRGRLRRANVSFHTGFVLANANGHNWVWKLWKSAPASKDYKLFEATSFDNAENLPADYVEDLRKMEQEAPHHFRRYVMNSSEEIEGIDSIISYEWIRQAINNVLLRYDRNRVVVACDPAWFGNDETVIYVLKEEKIIDSKIYNKRSTMETAGEINIMFKKHNAHISAVDVGMGAGIIDRLGEMEIPVVSISSNSASTNKRFKNLKAEMWFYAAELFRYGQVSIPDDNVLVEQLASVPYKMASNGQIEVESKEKVKTRLGRSPDRADALIYGLYALQFAQMKEKGLLEPQKWQLEMAG